MEDMVADWMAEPRRASPTKRSFRHEVRGSVMNFDFSTAKRIIFAPAGLRKPAPSRRSGDRVFSSCRQSSGKSRSFDRRLKARGLKVSTFSVISEPTVDDVRRGARGEGVRMRRRHRRRGGSVLDAASDRRDDGESRGFDGLLEIIGGGKRLSNPSLPFSRCRPRPERDRGHQNAVIASPEYRVKAS